MKWHKIRNGLYTARIDGEDWRLERDRSTAKQIERDHGLPGWGRCIVWVLTLPDGAKKHFHTKAEARDWVGEELL